MAFAQQLQQTHPPPGTTATSPLATSAAFLDLLCEIQSNRLDNTVNVSNGNGLGVLQPSYINGCPDSPGPSGISRPPKRSSASNSATASPIRRDMKDVMSPPARRTPRLGSAEELNGNNDSEVIGAALAAQRLGQSSPFHGTPTERIWAKTVVAHTKHHDPLAERGASAIAGLSSGIRMSPLTPRRHPPSSFQPNSPSTSRGDGAFAMAASSSDLWSPSSTSSCEDNTGLLNSPTEFNSCSQFRDKPPLVKTLESSWTISEGNQSDSTVRLTGPESNGQINGGDRTDLQKCPKIQGETVVVLPPTPTITSKASFQSQADDARSVSSTSSSDMSSGPNSKRASQSSNSENNTLPSEDSQSECSTNAGSNKRRGSGSCVVTPPPIPERPNFPPYDRHDSLSSQEEEDERELRGAPWFQAGIPREIALEILAQEPVGSFMVRESTSKPGCYALSLRVPRDFQPTGIAHYLIMRTHKGFKIKGFMKEFCTLTALITHHSVMPELLPCPLSLSRYNPVFRKQDTSEDLVDIEDPDYNLLADFRKVMSDLKV